MTTSRKEIFKKNLLKERVGHCEGDVQLRLVVGETGSVLIIAAQCTEKSIMSAFSDLPTRAAKYFRLILAIYASDYRCIDMHHEKFVLQLNKITKDIPVL